MRAYYLTGAQFGLSDLALRRVKIARFADLNDPFELLAVDLRDPDLRQAFQKTKDRINAERGLICVSRSWENPLLWGHYAEKHTGVALGLEIPDPLLAKVIYAKTPVRIHSGRRDDSKLFSEKMINRLLRTKFYDWRYEVEMRLFVQLDYSAGESGLYFHNFSDNFQLREVVLGPRCELPIGGVRRLIEDLEPEVEVIKSRIAYSSFRVIKDRAASRAGR